MNVGKELDSIVAEKLMGYTWHELDTGQKVLALSQAEAESIGVGESVYALVPDYSESLEAAWDVAEKLTMDGFWCLSVNTMNTAEIKLNNGRKFTDSLVYAVGDSVPHAICLAVLKVVAQNALMNIHDERSFLDMMASHDTLLNEYRAEENEERKKDLWRKVIDSYWAVSLRSLSIIGMMDRTYLAKLDARAIGDVKMRARGCEIFEFKTQKDRTQT